MGVQDPKSVDWHTLQGRLLIRRARKHGPSRSSLVACLCCSDLRRLCPFSSPSHSQPRSIRAVLRQCCQARAAGEGSPGTLGALHVPLAME